VIKVINNRGKNRDDEMASEESGECDSGSDLSGWD